MELKANETDKLIKGMQLKPTDDTIKYDWDTEAGSKLTPVWSEQKKMKVFQLMPAS